MICNFNLLAGTTSLAFRTFGFIVIFTTNLGQMYGGQKHISFLLLLLKWYTICVVYMYIARASLTSGCWSVILQSPKRTTTARLNHRSPQPIEHRKDQNLWRWNTMSWLGTGETTVTGFSRLIRSQPSPFHD